MVPVGFGKTVVSLTAVVELLAAGVFKRLLIAAPKRVCELTWATEYSKWAHLSGLNIAIAVGTAAERQAALQSQAKLVVVNFENLKKTLESKEGKSFDGLLIDELTKLKGGGQAFKAVRKAFKQFKWTSGMTGTLVEEGMEHLFYQMMAVDGGETFGRNKEKFLREYFIPDYMEYNWTPKEGTMEKLVEKISGITFMEEDYEERRAAIVDYYFVDMPDEARASYRDMAKEMLLNFDDDLFAESANAAVLSGKLRQICSGFVYTDNGAVTIHEDKMSAVLAEVSKAHAAGDNVLVVYTFLWELEYLQAALPHAKVFDGDARDTEAAWNAGAIATLLIHPKSAGHGLNLQYGGHRIIFCGPVWSRDQTDQVIGRLNRRGQTEEVRVTFVIARDTVEDIVMVPRILGKGETAGDFRRHLLSARA